MWCVYVFRFVYQAMAPTARAIHEIGLKNIPNIGSTQEQTKVMLCPVMNKFVVVVVVVMTSRARVSVSKVCTFKVPTYLHIFALNKMIFGNNKIEEANALELEKYFNGASENFKLLFSIIKGIQNNKFKKN